MSTSGHESESCGAAAAAAVPPACSHLGCHLYVITTLHGIELGLTADELAAIASPTLIVAGDRDVIRRDHVIALADIIPGARLLVVPRGHGDYLGEAFAAGDDFRAMSARCRSSSRFSTTSSEEPAVALRRPRLDPHRREQSPGTRPLAT
jgi:hypothetical protein